MQEAAQFFKRLTPLGSFWSSFSGPLNRPFKSPFCKEEAWQERRDNLTKINAGQLRPFLHSMCPSSISGAPAGEII